MKRVLPLSAETKAGPRSCRSRERAPREGPSRSVDTDGPYEITARAILIEEELDAALERKAREEGKSNAALIREYVGERLASLPPLATDPLARMAAADEFEPRPIHEVVYG